MNRSARARHAQPLAVLVLFTLLDLATGRDQQVLSLVVITPVVAATVLGRRATVGYTLLALVTAALLGVYDQQYTLRGGPRADHPAVRGGSGRGDRGRSCAPCGCAASRNCAG